MERGILLRPDVVELLRRFELLEIYTDAREEREYSRKQREITGVNANPTYIVLDSQHQREVTRFTHTNSTEAFKEFLRAGLTDQPAFQSRLRFRALVPLDGQSEQVFPITPVGTLTSTPGDAVTVLGVPGRAYPGEFEARQRLALPAELPAGRYRLEVELVTAAYEGETWRQALSVPVRLEFLVSNSAAP